MGFVSNDVFSIESMIADQLSAKAIERAANRTLMSFEQLIGVNSIQAGSRHQQRNSKVLAGSLKYSRRLVERDTRLFGENHPGAPAQLFVCRSQIGHQVAVDESQLDHRGRRQHVENQFFGGPRFHSRRTCDDFRADDWGNADMCGRGDP